MPRYAAERVLLAPVDDVWAFVAEPYHLSDWWPGISGVEPDRRGLAPGARWTIHGFGIKPSFYVIGFANWRRLAKRPGGLATTTLLVKEVDWGRRFAFDLLPARISCEIDLDWVDRGRTNVSVAMETQWGLLPRTLPRYALNRLYDLMQTAAEL